MVQDDTVGAGHYVPHKARQLRKKVMRNVAVNFVAGIGPKGLNHPSIRSQVDHGHPVDLIAVESEVFQCRLRGIRVGRAGRAEHHGRSRQRCITEFPRPCHSIGLELREIQGYPIGLVESVGPVEDQPPALDNLFHDLDRIVIGLRSDPGRIGATQEAGGDAQVDRSESRYSRC